MGYFLTAHYQLDDVELSGFAWDLDTDEFGVLAGTVYNADGTVALENAEVQLWHQDGYWLETTSTDVSGAYAFTVIEHIFGGSLAGWVPVAPDGGDPESITLGLKFIPQVPVAVVGVRFYKSQLNLGTHVTSLWASDGTLLAQTTPVSESGHGWQEAIFDAPVAVDVDAEYVCSYTAPEGHYSVSAHDLGFFGWGGLVRTVTGGANGVFVYTEDPSVFPTESLDASNYYVDVLYRRNG